MRQKWPLLMLVSLMALLGSADYLRSQIQTRVDLVVVPVSVRDSGGKLVPDLTVDDFIITESGQRQTISNFSVDPVPLSAAIVVDDGMGGDALRRLFPLFIAMTGGFAPEDEMASFRYDHFVWKLADFTNDPVAIQKSFEVIARIAETRPAQVAPGDPLAAGPGWLRTIGELFAGGIGSRGAPPTIPSGADRPKTAPTSRVLHDAIFDAATALSQRPKEQRKIIFIISDGQVSGANTHKLEGNIDLLLKNEIQVYAVSADYALFEAGLGVLNSYARASGGDVYSGGSTSSMEAAFSQITEQARNQYVLGYVSNNRVTGRGGVFREIDVRTRFSNHKVTHRTGYIQYPAGN